jgi:sugar lactone lactonase YvrE
MSNNEERNYTMGISRKRVGAYVFLVLALAASANLAPAFGDGPRIGRVVPVVNFELNPMWEVEGIAMSPSGDLYVGAPYEGEIFKVAPNGHVSVFARLFENPDDAYVVGLAVGGDESVYAAVMGCNKLEMNGVWRINHDGNASLVMPIPSSGCWATIPNALTFDENGNLYVTDSANGSLWRLGRHGDARMWVQDDLLKPVYAFGANGISYRDGSLWVLNFDAGSIVQIPILRDGRAGKPRTFVQSDLLVGIDGGQFDVAGNMYVGNVLSNNLLRVSHRGDVEILITAEQFGPYYWPTNPVFGFGHERSTIFISGRNPSVVKVDVGIPGLLLPQFEHKFR